MIGMFGALFGLAALLAGIVIQLANTGWRFAILGLPLAFAALTAAELRRSIETPDEPRGKVLADPAPRSSGGDVSRRS
jgi:membrane protein implicated in regulation of membrane protease activity